MTKQLQNHVTLNLHQREACNKECMVDLPLIYTTKLDKYLRVQTD